MNLDEAMNGKFLMDVPELPYWIPDVNPPSILDLSKIDFSKYTIDIFLPCQDPCPVCGGHNMFSGDWAYLGACLKCYHDEVIDMEKIKWDS